MEPTNKTADVTRWNRKDRRRLQKRTKHKIQGRNMPYVQSVHQSWNLYYELRAQEIKKDEEQINKKGEGIR